MCIWQGDTGMLTKDDCTGGAQSTLPEQEAQMKLSWGVWVHPAGEGTAEARRSCKSRGDAQVKFEKRHSCYGWRLSPSRGRRRRSSRGMHLTGLGGPGPPASPPSISRPPRPCTGRTRRMPRADAGRFQPGEAEAFRVLRRGGARPPPCASPPPLPSLLTAPRRGAEAAGPAAPSAPRSGVGTAGKVTDRGALSDGEGDLLGFGTNRGRAAAAPRPFRLRRAFRAGWRSGGALRGAPRGAAQRRAAAGKDSRRSNRAAARGDAVRSPPAGRPSLPAAPCAASRTPSDYSRNLLSAQCVRSR